MKHEAGEMKSLHSLAKAGRGQRQVQCSGPQFLVSTGNGSLAPLEPGGW